MTIGGEPVMRVAARGLSTEEALSLLGQTTRDVPLNDAAYWKNIPTRVWQFRASGYPVLKKWRSYREHNLLGERPLHDQEVRDFQDIAAESLRSCYLDPPWTTATKL